jgi:hypothetical protein
VCTGAERRKKARQGLGLGFKEKRRERETAAGAMAINGRGGCRRFWFEIKGGGVTEGELMGGRGTGA